MPREIAAVIVLKEFCQVSGNANGEDKCNRDPERTIKIRIDSLEPERIDERCRK